MERHSHDEGNHSLSKDQRGVLLKGYHLIQDRLHITTMRDHVSYPMMRADGRMKSDVIDEIVSFFEQSGLPAKDFWEMGDFVDEITIRNAEKLSQLRSPEKRKWWLFRMEVLQKIVNRGMSEFLELRERRLVRIEMRCQHLSTLLRMAAISLMRASENPVSRPSNSLQ